MATSSSGSPNDGRGADLAIFTGIWTHSSAHSDEVARAFRDDVAACSDMMSPGVWCLAGGSFVAEISTTEKADPVEHLPKRTAFQLLRAVLGGWRASRRRRQLVTSGR